MTTPPAPEQSWPGVTLPETPQPTLTESRGESGTAGFPGAGRGEMKGGNRRCGHLGARLAAVQGSCDFWKTTEEAAWHAD